jgi:protocatechuate 3,4-dioxygenase beta subunit
MNISNFIDHFRTKSISFVPMCILLIAALILTGCVSQTGTTTPVVSTLPLPESPTAASIQTIVKDSPPAAAEPTAASTTLPAINCTSPATLTPSSTEGPYFTAGSPERVSLVEVGMPGTVLILSGYVLTSDCQPVANAKLDFWQANANGVYDNQGYTLRGHQYTDENGFYQLTTVIPGEYPGRTEHIHFKVISPGGTELTSQLYFPGVGSNEGDSIFIPELLIDILEEGDTVTAHFTFVIAP